MTRTAVKIRNNTSWVIKPWQLGASDADWSDRFDDTAIKPGKESFSCSMGDPGRNEADHWGRLYFRIEMLDSWIYAVAFLKVHREQDISEKWMVRISKPEWDRKDTGADALAGELGEVSIVDDKRTVCYTVQDAKLGRPVYNPARWMGQLADRRDDIRARPVAHWALPASHDSGAYKPWNGGVTSGFVYTLDLYEQAKLGIRCFDLRIEGHVITAPNLPLASPFYFSAHHGLASDTSDWLSISPTEAGDNSYLVPQLRRFMDENPTEILILRIRHAGAARALFWRTLFDFLASYLVEVSFAKVRYGDLLHTGKRLILCAANEYRPKDDGDWRLLSDYDRYVCETISDRKAEALSVAGPYVDEGDKFAAPWKNDDPEGVIRAISQWASDVSPTHGYLWDAQAQLTTTSLADSIVKKTALMNPVLLHFLRDKRDMFGGGRHQWHTKVNIVQTDLVQADINTEIININIDRMGAADEW